MRLNTSFRYATPRHAPATHRRAQPPVSPEVRFQKALSPPDVPTAFSDVATEVNPKEERRQKQRIDLFLAQSNRVVKQFLQISGQQGAFIGMGVAIERVAHHPKVKANLTMLRNMTILRNLITHVTVDGHAIAVPTSAAVQEMKALADFFESNKVGLEQEAASPPVTRGVQAPSLAEDLRARQLVEMMNTLQSGFSRMFSNSINSAARASMVSLETLLSSARGSIGIIDQHWELFQAARFLRNLLVHDSGKYPRAFIAIPTERFLKKFEPLRQRALSPIPLDSVHALKVRKSVVWQLENTLAEFLEQLHWEGASQIGLVRRSDGRVAVLTARSVTQWLDLYASPPKWVDLKAVLLSDILKVQDEFQQVSHRAPCAYLSIFATVDKAIATFEQARADGIPIEAVVVTTSGSSYLGEGVFFFVVETADLPLLYRMHRQWLDEK